MAYVLRTWKCLNRRCGSEFESGEAYPPCSSCGGVKVQWVPGGGHVMHGATRHADRTVRQVAAQFGLTNLRSAREGEAAHPGLPAPKVIAGSQPLNAGLGIQVPRTMTPSATFAPMQRPLRGTLPTHARFRPRGGPIPTDVRYRTMKGDPR